MNMNYSVVPVRPAGGMWTSARDLSKYIQMELAVGWLPDGKQLVSKESLLERHKGHVQTGEDTTYGMGLVVSTQYGSASELPPEPKEIALDAATLGDYVGKYRFDFGAVFDVALKSDHLEAQLTGQATFPIFASAKDKFFYKVVDAQLDFARNAVGEVVAVVLHQNGRDMRAPRVTNQR